MDRLRAHGVYLTSGRLCLRPLTEADWDTLFVWNNDPEVLYYAEGGDITSWSMEAMKRMYRDTSRKALILIIELDGHPIGECWLQKMNLDRVLRQYPGLDVRRIDIMIGEKTLWGQGWGTRAIRLLVRLAFEHQCVDLLYLPEIADTNLRSRRAFEKNGFVVVQEVAQNPGKKFAVGYDLALTREAYNAMQRPEHQRAATFCVQEQRRKESP
jgi:RimJ/RimL family protein N-acetyltransferase